MATETPIEPALICFSYEYRSPAEAHVYEEITARYARRGIPTHNLFDAELHRTYEAGFNLARWEALDRFIKANDLFDRRIIMTDITDVYVVDPELEFDTRDVMVNRKKNCQFHGLKTLWRDITRPGPRWINVARRIDVDYTALDAGELKSILFDPRYRSIMRFSNDVLWGYGRSFVELHEKIRAHIESVPGHIRHGNCDERLYTYFHLRLPEARLNLRFGDAHCHNYNVISQTLLGAAPAREAIRSKKIITYQHSDHVPRLIAEISGEARRSPWRRPLDRVAYLLDRVLGGVLSLASIVLQAMKRLRVASMYLTSRSSEAGKDRRRSSPLGDPSSGREVPR